MWYGGLIYNLYKNPEFRKYFLVAYNQNSIKRISVKYEKELKHLILIKHEGSKKKWSGFILKVKMKQKRQTDTYLVSDTLYNAFVQEVTEIDFAMYVIENMDIVS